MQTPRISCGVAIALGTTIVVALAAAPAARGAVLCAKARRDGTLGGSLRIREEACTNREVEVDPAALGFCCEVSTTTVASSTTITVTSTSVCPTYTTTTLGLPDCGENVCFGLCPNALACVADDQGFCSCSGPEVSCQVVSAGGTCGGTCPEGLTCRTVQPIGEDGCPEAPRCGCAPEL